MTVGKFSLKWADLIPDNLDAVEQQIQKEIAEMQLSNIMDLMFHTVFLTDSLEGPTVFVYPSSDETLLCEYSPVTEWTWIDSDEGAADQGTGMTKQSQ